MADQLTALQIKIEADVANALSQLQKLAEKVVVVEEQVRRSVGKINASLKSFEKTAVNVKLSISGEDRLRALEQKLKDIQGDAAGGVTPKSPVRSQKPKDILPDQTEIESFVASVRAGVKASENEIAKFRDSLKDVLRAKELVVGVNDSEVVKLRKDLEFLNGFIADSRREIKIRVKADGDAEIKSRLANIQKEYALRIIPTFEDGTFNKLLNEIQNKRIDLTFDDVSASLKEEIARIQGLKGTLEVDADIAAAQSRINILESQLDKVQTIQVGLNTAPAQQSIAQLAADIQNKLLKEREIRINKIRLSDEGALSDLNRLKSRLERERVRLKGTADVSDITTKINNVKSEIKRLEQKGIRIKPIESLISTKAISEANQAVTLAKSIKGNIDNVRIGAIIPRDLGDNSQRATIALKAFEQVLRDSPSFAYSAQQGFIAISNNLPILSDAFISLAATSRATGQSIGGSLVAALKGPVGLSVAISAAITGISLLLPKIQEWISTNKGVVNSIGEVSEKNKQFADSVGSEAGEIVALTSAYGALSTSKESQKGIIEDLIKLAPKYFSILDKEKSSVEDLTKATDKYIQSLSAKIIFETQKEEIGKVFKEYSDEFTSKLRNFLKNRQKLLSEASKTQDLLGIKPGDKIGINDIFDEKLQQQSVDVAVTAKPDVKSKQTLQDFTKELGDTAQKEVDKINKIFAPLFEQFDFSKVFGEDPKTDSKRSLTDREKRLQEELEAEKKKLEKRLSILKQFVKDYGDQLSALQKQQVVAQELSLEDQILNLDLQLNLLGVDSNKAKNDIKETIDITRTDIENQYSKEALQIGIATIDVSGIQKQVEEARDKARQSGEKSISPEGTPKKLELPTLVFEDRLKTLREQLDGLTTPLFGANFSPDYFRAFEEPLKEIEERIKTLSGVINEAAESAKKLNDQLAQILASGVADLFGTIFEKAAEGTLTFETLGESVSKFAQDIIKAVAKLLIMNAILKALGASVTGGASAGGGGFDFLEFLFRGFKPRKFATGGIITGPTFGMVGESGTEAVLPLSYLSNLIGGTGQSTPSLALRGSDLYWIWSQENRKNNRYF